MFPAIGRVVFCHNSDASHRAGLQQTYAIIGEMRSSRFVAILFTFLGFIFSTSAEEGMWTLNNFPTAKVKEQFGFAPDAKWLEHARLSSARFGNGCSSSFVSGNGLLMTNHHCATACIQ